MVTSMYFKVFCLRTVIIVEPLVVSCDIVEPDRTLLNMNTLFVLM